jgi:hypothetical protein
MKAFTALFLPLLAAAAPLTTQATADMPSANEITIISAETSGNGCPSGTVSTSISSDRTVVTFGFDKFQTYIGPGVAASEKTKACQIHLNLKYPGGFTFAVLQATYHGYAQLDVGVTGTFLSTYFFSQSASSTTTTRTTLTGGGSWAAGQVYTKTDTIPTASLIFCPCGANGILNVNNRIALTSTNTKAAGQVSDDDATVAFTQQINLQWQRCK